METQDKKKLLPVDLETFNDIELSEDEIKLALLKAKQAKSAEIKMKAYSAKLKQERQDPIYTAEQLKKLLLENSKIQIDAFNERIIWSMCLYFTNDARSELNPEKGLLLYGGIGCGKTTLMDWFKINQKASYQVKSSREVSYSYSKHGADSILKYNGLIDGRDSNPAYGHKDMGVCFDDLGTEVDKKHFGNESNVMAEILLNRYDRHSTLKGLTHITTNLNVNEIGERYGDRVRSRLREMFNVLVFDEKSPDRRK